MTTSRYYHSAMRGAPVISGNATGSALSALTACLVHGFGSTAVSALVVASGLATATVDSGVPYEVGSTINISGASPAGLNGDWRVIASSATSVSWSTTVADGSASGTITVKVAPMGWAKPYTDTNIAVFTPTAAEATGCLLRVDATSAVAMRVIGYESMSDVNTGTGPFPTGAQRSGGGYWPCCASANASSIPWEIYASDTGFHFVCAPLASNAPTYLGRTGWWFGDLVSLKSGDAWHCALISGSASNSAEGTNFRSVNGASSFDMHIARSFTQTGGSIRAGRFSPLIAPLNSTNTDGQYSGSTAHGGTYPNGANAGLILSPLLVVEGNAGAITGLRGRIPGVFHTSQKVLASTFGPRDVIVGTGEMAGRRMHAAPGYATASNLTQLDGATFFDISGDWS